MIFKKSNVMDFNPEVSLPRLTQEETQYTPDKIILREAGNDKVLRFSDLYNYAKYNNKSIQESVTDIERENHIANPVFVVNETQYYLDEDYRNAVSDLSVFSKLMFDSNPESGLIYNAMMEAVDYSLENDNTDLLDAVIEEVCSMDIPFTTIIGIICGDNSELKRYILSIVSSNSDFFKSSYVAVINSSIRPEIITAIRFKIQEIAIAHDQTVSPSDIEVMATGGETPNTDNE